MTTTTTDSGFRDPLSPFRGPDGVLQPRFSEADLDAREDEAERAYYEAEAEAEAADEDMLARFDGLDGFVATEVLAP